LGVGDQLDPNEPDQEGHRVFSVVWEDRISHTAGGPVHPNPRELLLQRRGAELHDGAGVARLIGPALGAEMSVSFMCDDAPEESELEE
jgi:hypothetical protein